MGGNIAVTGEHPGTYHLNQEMKVNINNDMRIPWTLMGWGEETHRIFTSVVFFLKSLTSVYWPCPLKLARSWKIKNEKVFQIRGDWVGMITQGSVVCFRGWILEEERGLVEKTGRIWIKSGAQLIEMSHLQFLSWDKRTMRLWKSVRKLGEG